MNQEVRQFTVAPDGVRKFVVSEDDEGIRLDRWFKRHLPQLGFATVSRWARTGQVRVDGKRARPEDRLVAGQVLRVPPGGEIASKPKPKRREPTAEQLAQAEAMLIHRTDAALVLNKPPGLATQGGTGTHLHVDGLLDAFHSEDEPRPRLVHRLDKDTSGVLLVARTPGSAAFFSKRFSGRSAKKVYWALVVGVPEVADGTIDAPLAKQPGTGGEKMHVDTEGGQAARTRYRVLDRAGNRAAWVELEPLTGRTHQLRVHMAAIGHPVVGDGKYGGQDAFLTGSISRKMHLHARRLLIDAPGGGALDVTAELPEHFAASMAQLGFDPSASAAEPAKGPPPPSRAVKKQAAKAHAKTYRKARRGERRGPGDRPNEGPQVTVRLAVFDCDGTLSDGQAAICAAMAEGFAEAGLAAPDPHQVRRIVGLSLPGAIALLAPDETAEAHSRVVQAYKQAFFRARERGLVHEPLFEGVADLLARLHGAGWALGVATGKSDRGLHGCLTMHGVFDLFLTLQTADRHPSKPHPAMIEAAMAEAGARPADTVMVGDTVYDIEMGRAAGCRAIGVAWGYHDPAELLAAGAEAIAATPTHLGEMLDGTTG